MLEIICNNETLVLSHHRAVFWARKKMLIIADLHLGKTSYFRSKGVPIPSTIMMDDLHRLSALINTFNPQTILVAGDMFHHNYNADIELFKKWRSKYTSIQLILVPGNHDKMLDIDYENLGINLADKEFISEPFLITHYMNGHTGNIFSISGHLHPGYIIEGRAKQFLRLPCFIISSQGIILPAFSGFTGLYTGYEPHETNRYYVVGHNNVFMV